MTEKMKVNPKYIQETIEEYNKSKQRLYENNSKPYPTCEMNGGIYYKVDMTSNDFARQNNATNMEDIRWT